MAKQYAPEAFRNGRNQKLLNIITEKFYKRGLELSQTEQLDNALELFDLLVRCNVVRPNLNYERANILFKSDRINEAAQAAYEELKLQPDHRRSKAIIRLAEAYPHKASQSHQKCLGEELFKMGVEFLSNGNPQEAVKYFNEVLADFPAMPDLYYAMATAYAQIGTLYVARQACEIAIKLQSEHDSAHKLLARLNQAINIYAGESHIGMKTGVQEPFNTTG
jgi:predicted Zn-dependent protease